jgi:hypothetical protein
MPKVITCVNESARAHLGVAANSKIAAKQVHAITLKGCFMFLYLFEIQICGPGEWPARYPDQNNGKKQADVRLLT